jgi:RNA polymerase sigma factor for flagellar operon FliA
LGDEAQDPKKGLRGRPGLNRKPRPSAASPAREGSGPKSKDASGSTSVATHPRRASSRSKPPVEAVDAIEETETSDADMPPPPDMTGEIPPDIAAQGEILSIPPPSKNMTRKELTDQYQPYVRSIAGKIKKTLSKDIEFDDLVQYGMMGLFEAADRYDAKFGANFMTFAYYRIRGAIYDGLRSMGWVSRTEYQRYRFEMQANAYLGAVNDQQAAGGAQPVRKTTDDEVSELADVVTGLVTIYVTALDAMEGFQIKDDRGPSVDESLEILQARKLVAEAVAKLPEQEKTLLQLYYYQEMSLEDVGKRLGLSKSWTSRLHTRAIEKLSRLLRDLVSEYQDSGQGGGGGGGGGAPRTSPGAKSTQPTGPPTR